MWYAPLLIRSSARRLMLLLQVYSQVSRGNGCFLPRRSGRGTCRKNRDAVFLHRDKRCFFFEVSMKEREQERERDSKAVITLLAGWRINPDAASLELMQCQVGVFVVFFLCGWVGCEVFADPQVVRTGSWRWSNAAEGGGGAGACVVQYFFFKYLCMLIMWLMYFWLYDWPGFCSWWKKDIQK